MGVKRNLDEAGIADNSSVKITEDEAALYDRQIRLWGMECQTRLRESRILVIGLNGVGAEVVKNLTLSGVRSITILDDAEVTAADTTAQFFISSYKQGQTRGEASVSGIRELNPNVNVNLSSGDIFSKPENFFKDYNVMVATDCSVDALIKLDKLCIEHNIQFYCTDTWGFYGFCFLDLQSHTFRSVQPGSARTKESKEIPKRGVEELPRLLHTAEFFAHCITEQWEVKKYCPLGPTLLTKVGEGLRKRVNKVFVLLHVVNHFREMFNRYPSPETRESDVEELKKLRTIVCETLSYDASKIDDGMLSSVFGQLSPVCAVVGGVLANEIIKGITRTGLPVYNYFLFDGNESVGVNETILVD